MIALRRTSFTIDSNMEGTGCIGVWSGSVLTLLNPNKFGNGQLIYMYLDTDFELKVGDKPPKFDLTVVNFGTLSRIKFSESMQMNARSDDGMFLFN